MEAMAILEQIVGVCEAPYLEECEHRMSYILMMSKHTPWTIWRRIQTRAMICRERVPTRESVDCRNSEADRMAAQRMPISGALASMQQPTKVMIAYVGDNDKRMDCTFTGPLSQASFLLFRGQDQEDVLLVSMNMTLLMGMHQSYILLYSLLNITVPIPQSMNSPASLGLLTIRTDLVKASSLGYDGSSIVLSRSLAGRRADRMLCCSRSIYSMQSTLTFPTTRDTNDSCSIELLLPHSVLS